jgi:hypothetical protein
MIRIPSRRLTCACLKVPRSDLLSLLDHTLTQLNNCTQDPFLFSVQILQLCINVCCLPDATRLYPSDVETLKQFKFKKKCSYVFVSTIIPNWYIHMFMILCAPYSSCSLCVIQVVTA